MASSIQPLFLFSKDGMIRCALRHLVDFEAAILMYHRFRSDATPGYVISRSDFADQMLLLRRHYKVVSLEEALASSRQRRVVAITVDDGYRSFADIAFPVLSELRFPVTVFLPVKFIDDGGWLWQDRNIFVLRACPRGQWTFNWADKSLHIDTRERQALFATMRRIYAACAVLPEMEQLAFSRRLGELLGVELPALPVAEFAPLTWERIRELQTEGVVFGSHTTGHRLLTLCDHEVARREIVESRRVLRDRLEREVSCFAYPNGDFNRFVRQAVEESGYGSALTTRPEFWRQGDDRFTVPRIPAPAGGGKALAAQMVRYWWRRYRVV